MHKVVTPQSNLVLNRNDLFSPDVDGCTFKKCELYEVKSSEILSGNNASGYRG